MKTVSFFNRKGGVGKTALSFMFARYVAAAGNKVIFIDLDPQRTATNHFLRCSDIAKKDILERNIFEVLLDRKSVAACLLSVDTNTDLLAGTYDLAEIQATASPFCIQDVQTVTKDDYDYMILDNAPNFSNIIQASIVAADAVIIPTLPALEDVEQAHWTLDRVRKINRAADVRVLLNQFSYDRFGSMIDDILTAYRPIFGESLFDFAIPQSQKIRAYTATCEHVTTAKSKAAILDGFAALYSYIAGANVPALVDF